MKALSLTLSLIIASIHSDANTYYVSSSGNNSNSGQSPAAAFQTIQHAANLVSAGDTVNVLSGNYTGFTLTTSGTFIDRIIFIADTGVLINIPNSTGDGINLEGASYITIDGFSVYGVPRAGLRAVLDTGIIFRNNRADSCGIWGILTGFSEYITIENNECSRSVDEHGIYFSNSADNPIIRNNHCWGNNACGIQLNGDVNLQPGDGIISNALVERNLIHDNGNSGGSGINCDGVQNSVISNNLLYNNHSSGISLYKIDGGGSSTENIIVNNTILQPVVSRWAINISDASIGNTVFNNILYSEHSFRGSISIDATSLADFISDYNVLSDRLSNNGGNSNMTLSQWQQSGLNDNHSILSTPLQMFKDIANNDYHLTSGSHARNTGTDVLNSIFAPLIDFEGNLRPQGQLIDIGCYEFLKTVSVDEINKTDWSELSEDTPLNVYDITGRYLFSCTKNELKSQMNNRHGFFILHSDKFNKVINIFQD